MRTVFFFLFNILPFFIMSQNENVVHDWNCVPPIIPHNDYEYIYFQRSDTVFCMNIYPSKVKLDSVVCKVNAQKTTGGKWIIPKNADGVYSIVKFEKIKPSVWFEENNGKLFHAEFECKPKGVSKSYSPNGEILIRRLFFKRYHIKTIRPKENQYNLHIQP